MGKNYYFWGGNLGKGDERKYLQAFGTIDGTQWTKNAKHTKNFHRRHRFGSESEKILIFKGKFLGEKFTYKSNKEVRETQTTSKSSKLKADRQKAPL